MTAMALGICVYVMPLAMVANPAMIGLAESTWIGLATGGQVAVGLSLVAHDVAGTAVIFLPSLLSG